MIMERKSTGALGEKLAADFLKKRGYRILETNYRCRWGEIDLVAQQKDYLVFVEVRTKSNRDFGSPEESINAGKKRHMERAASYYQQVHEHLPEQWRIDLVAVDLDANSRLQRIELIENALEEY
jgi:putative endonuclease